MISVDDWQLLIGGCSQRIQCLPTGPQVIYNSLLSAMRRSNCMMICEVIENMRFCRAGFQCIAGFKQFQCECVKYFCCVVARVHRPLYVWRQLPTMTTYDVETWSSKEVLSGRLKEESVKLGRYPLEDTP